MTTRDKDAWLDGDGDGEVDEDLAATDDDALPETEEDASLGMKSGDPGDPADAGDAGDADPLDDLPLPPLYDDAEAAFDPARLTGVDADLAAERDQYKDALFRVKADFDNYRKRIAKDHAATVERAAEKLVGELLPVLDACEAALGQGLDDVEPIYKSLMDTLEKGGLVRLSPEGEPFDPNLHEAVMHEPSDDEDEHVVIESLRTGYTWNGRVLRPAMVKVRG